MNNIILQNIDREEFVAIIQAVVANGLENVTKVENVTPNLKLLTRKQTAEMLHVSLMTLYKWNKADVLKAYGVGNRVYYKLEDVELALQRVA